jgi:hypothetical protein
MDEAIGIGNIFVTANAILVGALSIGPTEGLKVGISLLGAVLTILWLCCREKRDSRTTKLTVLELGLPVLFLLAWFTSLVIHLPRFLS